LGAETSGRESDGTHEVGIDYAETFLLSGTYKLRAIYLYAIDVDAVFVVRSTTH